MTSILYFSVYGTLARGGQKSLWYILRDLDRARFRPVLTCLEEGELTRKARERDIPVEVVRLPRLRPWKIFSLIRCLADLKRIRDRHGVDIVHTEELPFAFFFSLLKIFAPVRIVWHVRVMWDNPRQKKIGLMICDRVFCVSKTVAKTFPESPKVMVVPNGVDVNEYHAAAEDPAPANAPRIGFVGSLVQLKGIDVLIRALPDTLRTFPAAQLHLIGSGAPEFVDSLKTLAGKLGISDRVIFRGEVTENLPAAMRAFTLFVLPSRSEGMSRSLLEAMALGLPVVASDIPQNAELIEPEKNGLLFKTDDPDDLALKMLDLLGSPRKAEEMGGNAASLVARAYSSDTTLNAITSRYETLMAETARHHAGKRSRRP